MTSCLVCIGFFFENSGVNIWLGRWTLEKRLMLSLCGAHLWILEWVFFFLRSKIKNAAGEGLHACSSFIFIYLYIFKFHTFPIFPTGQRLGFIFFFPLSIIPEEGSGLWRRFIYFFDCSRLWASVCDSHSPTFTFSALLFVSVCTNSERSSITLWFLLFQYYEMSYGLNIEMHKQVSDSWFLSVFTSVSFSITSSQSGQFWVNT